MLDSESEEEVVAPVVEKKSKPTKEEKPAPKQQQPVGKQSSDKKA